jgi:glutathione S-transferase
MNALATQSLRLYVDASYASPYAMSVFVALHEKALDFDIVTLDLAAGAHHSADFAALSLTHRVPTLVDGTFALSESSAITEYLDEQYPGIGLYPRDAQARARAASRCPRQRSLQPAACMRQSIRFFPSERKICSERGPSSTPTSHSCSTVW